MLNLDMLLHGLCGMYLYQRFVTVTGYNVEIQSRFIIYKPQLKWLKI
jgi:hypothetical protein